MLMGVPSGMSNVLDFVMLIFNHGNKLLDKRQNLRESSIS